MRFIISLSIILIAFDATKIRSIKQALATADVEVRNFWKIRFSPVKFKVILQIVKRGTKRALCNAILSDRE
jgi:hypothetical protein